MINVHNERHYVMGMHWADCSHAWQAHALVMEHDAWSVCVSIVDGNRRAVVHGGYPDDLPDAPAYSAALAVGALYPEGIVVHEFQEDSVWFALLRGGAPAVGFERFVTNEGAFALLRDHMTHGTPVVGTAVGATVSLRDAFDQVERGVRSGTLSARTCERMRLMRPGAAAMALDALAGGEVPQ